MQEKEFAQAMTEGALDRAHLLIDIYRFVMLSMDTVATQAAIERGHLDNLEQDSKRIEENKEASEQALSCMTVGPEAARVALIIALDLLAEYVAKDIVDSETTNPYKSSFIEITRSELQRYQDIVNEYGGTDEEFKDYWWRLEDPNGDDSVEG